MRLCGLCIPASRCCVSGAKLSTPDAGKGISKVLAAATARILSQPLAFQAGSAALCHDPAQLRTISRKAVPVERVHVTGDTQGFAYKASSLRLPDLRLVALANSPLEAEVGSRRGSVVVLPYGGRGECVQDEHHLPMTGHTSLVYLTGASYTVLSDYLNTAFFCVDPRRLRRTARELAPYGLNAQVLNERLATPQLLRGDQPLEAELLRQLRRTLALCDLPLLCDSPLLGAMGIDELIYRQLVQLLCLSAPAQPAKAQVREQLLQERILDNLLAWIEANLHLPLRMADLERESTYSVRMLQLAFRRRCGCSPMQWVRTTRMARALRLLEHPQSDTSVLTVAIACGYTNRAAFSRDFRQQHLQCPSHVLRQARLRLQQHALTA
jgi:AraC-like DNA-binding protein